MFGEYTILCSINMLHRRKSLLTHGGAALSRSIAVPSPLFDVEDLGAAGQCLCSILVQLKHICASNSLPICCCFPSRSFPPNSRRLAGEAQRFPPCLQGPSAGRHRDDDRAVRVRRYCVQVREPRSTLLLQLLRVTAPRPPPRVPSTDSPADVSIPPLQPLIIQPAPIQSHLLPTAGATASSTASLPTSPPTSSPAASAPPTTSPQSPASASSATRGPTGPRSSA